MLENKVQNQSYPILYFIKIEKEEQMKLIESKTKEM